MKDSSDYIDDETIKPTCRLMRRIHPDWIVHDKNIGRNRISSQGFKALMMSVHLGDDLADAGHEPKAVLINYPDQDLAAVIASTARILEQAVCRDDQPGQLCHGIVAGKKTGRIAKALAIEATSNWIICQTR